MPRSKSVKSVKTPIQTDKTDLLERFVPILLVVCVGLAFTVGMLWQKVSTLEKGTSATQANTQTNPAAAQPTKVDLAQVKDLFKKDLIKIGDENRKVLFVEVADPSCPYCHAAGGFNHTIYQGLGSQFQLTGDGGSYDAPVPEMKKLVDAGKASFVYIYFPGHGNGEMGARALYCANETGKFWQVHDLLMSDTGYTLMNNTVKNDKANAGALADFLKSVIDPNQLKSCVTSTKYDQRLKDDENLARTMGITGTPGFLVNEAIYAGAYSFKDMKATVDAAL